MTNRQWVYRACQLKGWTVIPPTRGCRDILIVRMDGDRITETIADGQSWAAIRAALG